MSNNLVSQDHDPSLNSRDVP